VQKIKLPVSFKDRRGKIIDLLEGEDIDAVTIVTFKKGAVRGNHHHKKTTQWNYLISGKIKMISLESGSKPVAAILKKGDFMAALPNDHHTLIALEESELLVLTRGPRGGKDYESDTYRAKGLRR